MISLKKTHLFLLFLTFNTFSYAQGCSDAGFCTIDSFKPQTTDSLMSKNQLKTGVSYGKADNSITAIANYIEYNRQISSRLGLDFKLTSLSQNGNQISIFGLSDLFLNSNYKITTKWNVTVGAKIPFNSANKSKNNVPLPMDYQASLGTFDLILGTSYQVKKIQFVVAFQQPLTQNKNEFIADSNSNSSLQKFTSTNNFKRSADVLLRVSYPFGINEKLKFTPSLLPIYHLTNDKFTNINGQTQEIDNSAGLTLNANTYFDYQLNTNSFLQLSLGMPFIVRKIRPDGLTRSFIANLEYRITF